MVTQYPHSLVIQPVVAGVILTDENGNVVQVNEAPEQPVIIKCRAEVGSGRFVPLQDGSKYEYSFTIYVLGSELVPDDIIGQTITVNAESGLIVNAAVKQMSKGQLNTRLWV